MEHTSWMGTHIRDTSRRCIPHISCCDVTSSWSHTSYFTFDGHRCNVNLCHTPNILSATTSCLITIAVLLWNIKNRSSCSIIIIMIILISYLENMTQIYDVSIYYKSHLFRTAKLNLNIFVCPFFSSCGSRSMVVIYSVPWLRKANPPQCSCWISRFKSFPLVRSWRHPVFSSYSHHLFQSLARNDDNY